MKNKTNKTVTKRIRITKNGKMIRKPIGQDHFRSRKNGSKIRKTHSTQDISAVDRKTLQRMLG